MQAVPVEMLHTPWPEQEVAWRLPNPVDRHAALAQQISPPHLYVVREVPVQNCDTGEIAKSKHDIKKSLRHTRHEFELLKACGFSVASTEWHAFRDLDGVLHTLARVAIIDGIHPDNLYTTDVSDFPDKVRKLYYEAKTMSAAYYHTRAKGPRLLAGRADHEKLVFGVPRLKAKDSAIPKVVLTGIESVYDFK